MARQAIPLDNAVRAGLALVAVLLAAPVLAQGAAAPVSEPAAPSTGGGPKSLLPDDLPDTGPEGRAAPEEAVSILPEGAAPAPPPSAEIVATPVASPTVTEPVDPFAALSGPTGRPENAGLIGVASYGFAGDLFEGSDARFLAALLNRLDAPLASRWAQILLQRALLSRATPPPGLHPSDWLAARAAALIAIGAGADAHRMVSRTAIDHYTARLYAVAAQAALVTGDPMALCPLSPTARALTQTPTWTLIDAMCAAVLGDDYAGTVLFDRLRRQNDVNGFDIGLAERIASAAGGGRRGANPEWGEAGELTAWRLGLASAAGLELPEEMVANASPAQKAWITRLPGQPLSRRAALAPEAAATGAISSAELSRILAAEAAQLTGRAVAGSPGGQLRTAHSATDPAARVAAMRALWKRGEEGRSSRYGWRLATASAAAQLRPAASLAADAPDIAASLVSAGITAPAQSWWRVAEGADRETRAKLWAQLVAVDSRIPVEKPFFEAWAASVPPNRARLLAAGLAGLGRGDVGGATPPITNDWTQALDAAVAARRTGEVMLLCATGLQGNWAMVAPDYLRRIAAALTAVGHGGEARLIVAEAASRG